MFSTYVLDIAVRWTNSNIGMLIGAILEILMLILVAGSIIFIFTLRTGVCILNSQALMLRMK